jgi:hypothetical protein
LFSHESCPMSAHGIIHLHCVHTFLFCGTAASIEYIP